MKRLVLAVAFMIALAGLPAAEAQDADLNQAIERYNRAFKAKDVETIKTLLAPEVLLYEHSVRNDGLQDVFENHLKPEIVEFENLQLDFSDLRVTPGADLALVTRQYKISGRLRGRDISAGGNETMVWRRKATEWKIVHIHYSHPCPRPASPPK